MEACQKTIWREEDEMANIQGTNGNDVLVDTAATDTIDGLDGNDQISSTHGGFDTLNGGNGNDRILASAAVDGQIGPIAANGGAGDDFIRFTGLRDTGAVISGGADNDRIEIDTQRAAFGIAIDAGTGNDVVVLNEWGDAIVNVGLTLGAGVDVVRFTTRNATDTKLHVTIQDFTTGAGGDRIDFGDYLYLLSGWSQTTNPFTGGFVFLGQQGADAVLYVDRDGTAGAGTTLNPLITFKNTTVASLTAYNFFGYDPGGAAPSGLVINGTAGDDTLTGEAGADTIHGLGGNDTIDGKNGSDAIYGDEGNDILSDYEGADVQLYGGIGNDTLIVSRASPTYILSGTVDGGDNDDVIDVTNGSAALTVLGGAGADTIRIIGPGMPVVDAGIGNDTIIAMEGTHLVTLGAGADVVRYQELGSIRVADFQVGAGGDSIDVTSALLVQVYLWDYATNPFATQHIFLEQSGPNTLVYLDLNGTAGGAHSHDRLLATLDNVVMGTLTAANFGGWDPAGTQPAGQIINGTPGPDTLTGGIGGDTINGLGDNDTIKGYVGNDTINGGAGNDVLDGEWGSDVVDGGGDNDTITDAFDGNDTLRGGDGNDVITLTRARNHFDHGPSNVVIEGNDGSDTIRLIGSGLENGEYIDAAISAGLGSDLVQIGAMHSGTIDLGDGADRLELTSYFQPINAQMTLGAGQDLVVYLRPSIDPGTKTITDFQVGDSGDRIEFLEFGALSFAQQGANTLVIETVGPATRTVLVLENVQAAQLTAYNKGQGPTGTSGNDVITGDDNVNTIHGLAGNDVLYGRGAADNLYGDEGNDILDGGTGNDRMEGGTGDDNYYVSDAGDIIVEAVGGGNDGVYSYISYVLTPGAEVETLSTISHAATTAINLTGNAFAQTIVGNAGANVLHGGGGADLLVGLGGNDTYYVDQAGVTVSENAGGGTDTIYVSFSYTLGGNVEVETLSTNDYGSTQAINLTGNAFNQTLIGNAGANVLHGGGGVDSLIGLGGNDTYYIDVAGTQAYEAAAAGTDVIYTSVSYALAAGNEIETLSSNNYGATTAINLTGNASAQTVVGNAGANTLNGGAGADTLYGLGGADNFDFTTALGGGNVDYIADFSVVDDTVELDDAIFAGIGTAGAFNPNAFFAGAAAHDADDRIIYNSATGQLFYDADGNGGGAAVQFATLAGNPVLTASDFQVI
jgi:Ca2+-binding RTX toxin-like protein